MALHGQLDATDLAIQPRRLHHDLQPVHLVVQANGTHLLLDRELAAFGDPLSDLARLAARLHLEDPTPVLALTEVSPGTQRRSPCTGASISWPIPLWLPTHRPAGRSELRHSRRVASEYASYHHLRARRSRRPTTDRSSRSCGR